MPSHPGTVTMTLENDLAFYEFLLDCNRYRELLQPNMPTPHEIIFDEHRWGCECALNVSLGHLVLNSTCCHHRVVLSRDVVKKIIEELTRAVAMTPVPAVVDDAAYWSQDFVDVLFTSGPAPGVPVPFRSEAQSDTPLIGSPR